MDAALQKRRVQGPKKAHPTEKIDQSARRKRLEPAPSLAPQAEIAQEMDAPAAQETGRSVTMAQPPKEAPPFRVLGEAFRTYIVVESGKDLLLTDAL